MEIEVRREGAYWSVFVDGRRTVDRESHTVAQNVAWHLEHPEAWEPSESAEVADAIRKHYATD